MATANEPSKLRGTQLCFAALWCCLSLWIVGASMLSLRGLYPNLTWGGLTVSALFGYLAWFTYHLVTRRHDGIAIGMVCFMPIVNARSVFPGMTWSTIVLSAGESSGIMFLLWTVAAFLIRAMDKTRAANKASIKPPQWDADSDPIAAGGPY